MRTWRYSPPAALAVGLIAAAPAGSSVAATTAAACTPATNIEAIVEDSGGLAKTDPDRLRVRGLEMLLGELSPATTFGAVEFGGSFDTTKDSADTVFAPQPIGPNAAAMNAALVRKIDADNGLTDYNAAFAQSDQDDPGAQARILVVDRGPTTAYRDGHLAHRVPTYVAGFGPHLSASAAARLETIAKDTGGRYFAMRDASRLEPTMDRMYSALTCRHSPHQFKDDLRKGESTTHTVTIASGTNSVQIALTWASPLDRFRLYAIPRRLTVKVDRSATYAVAKVSGLAPGKLSFKVMATTIGSGKPPVTLTTQVTRSRSR